MPPLFEEQNRNNEVTDVDDKQTENFHEKLEHSIK